MYRISSFSIAVRHLLEAGTLLQGCVLIVDNCNIHIKGDNICVQGEVFQNHGILMTILPHCYPDFNLTEIVFGTLLRRLSCDRARYKSIDVKDFCNVIEIEMCNFNLKDKADFLSIADTIYNCSTKLELFKLNT